MLLTIDPRAVRGWVREYTIAWRSFSPKGRNMTAGGRVGSATTLPKHQPSNVLNPESVESSVDHARDPHNGQCAVPVATPRARG